MAQFVARLYALLLQLYPHSFRTEFKAEMQAVFAEAVAEARRTGIASLAVVCLRELKDLPSSLLREHWRGILKGIAMNENRQPGSWKDAALAGLPHLLVVVLALLPLGTVKNGSTIYPVFLFVLPGFMAAALALAWRRGWPRWSASWYVYVALVILIPVLNTPLRVVAPLAFAVCLYWITRRDQIKGLLTAMPPVLLFWIPVLEFVEPTLHNSIMLGMVLLAAVIAVAIVRLNNVRFSVWLIIGASVLTGLLAAYARTYWHNLPPEHSEPPTLAALAELFAPQLLAGSTLVIGPLLLWGLWQISKRSGR